MVEFLKFIVPLGGAVIAWFLNERRKRAWEEYQLKEANYKELLLSLKGFYQAWNDDDEKKQLKNKFIDQLNLCWLYSPDDVIFLGYNFLEILLVEKSTSADQKQEALGRFILAIRKDLLSRRITRKTNLEAIDFKLLTST